MNWTLRTRLLVGAATAMGVILLVAGVVVYAFVRTSLLSEFDGGLLSTARGLQSATEQRAGHVKMEEEAERLPAFSRAEEPDYYTAWLDDGRVISRSNSLGKGLLDRPAAVRSGGSHDYMVLPDGRRGRQVALTFTPPAEPEDIRNHRTLRTMTVVVARHTGALDDKLARLRWLLIGVGVAAVAAGTGALGWVVGRGLRPLSLLARQIEKVDQENLGARVELARTPVELSAVVARLNELLARLEAGVGRERAFTADVAHELRTPLAGLEAALDVCASRPRTVTEYQKTVERCRGMVRGMHGLVENLLMLARTDARQIAPKLAPIALRSFVDEIWTQFEARAIARGLEVEIDVDPELQIETDPDLLRIILQNLFDNAISYCNTGGRIWTKAATNGRVLLLSVRNTGSVLTQAAAEQAVDRFWRGDAARSDTGLHCGLGLSLCKKTAELLGARMSIRSQIGGEFEASYEFARAEAAYAPGQGTQASLLNS
jgi:signal transduction histidine kinase